MVGQEGQLIHHARRAQQRTFQSHNTTTDVSLTPRPLSFEGSEFPTAQRYQGDAHNGGQGASDVDDRCV